MNMDFEPKKRLIWTRVQRKLGYNASQEEKEYIEKQAGLVQDLVDLKDYEGLMIKNPYSTYAFERSKEWKKVKPRKNMIIDFTGYEDNDGGSVTAFNELGHRVKIGKDVKKFKDEIALEGKCSVDVWYLEKTFAGKLRQITLKEVKV